MSEQEENISKLKPEEEPSQAHQEHKFQDLGLGSKLGSGHTRMIGKDGLINVKKTGGGLDSINIFQELLAMNWIQFFLLITSAYVFTNMIFAFAYMTVGVENLSIPPEVKPTFFNRFAYCFYFSAQTFTTVGYGTISPVGNLAHLIATFEAMLGLMGFAVVTGVLYGRFSRPTARISYSNHAVIAPYQNINGLMFKMVNKRKNQLMELEVQVAMRGHVVEGGEEKQVFFTLDLERDKVTLFPLTWTIVHPITTESPLYGKSAEELEAMSAEFLVLVKGFDDTFSQTVHSRTSYTFAEVVWGKKFIKSFREDESGAFLVEIDKIDDYQDANLNVY
ncbi:MAG: ion channel [Bacteroidota bacterium]